MTKGPWDQPDTPPTSLPRPAAGPPVPSHRVWLWLGLLVAVGVLVAALIRAYPEAIQTGQDQANLFLKLSVVVLVSTALLRGLQGSPRQYLKYAAIWTGVIAVLALGYAYRAELSGVPQKLKLAFNVGAPVAVGERTLVVPQGEDGHYVVDGMVNDQRVRFIVDTGATETVLSPADARRLGIPVDTLNYGYESETANGKGYSAAYDTTRLEVGSIRLEGFRVMVNKAPMSGSLLGMSFLSRLDAFEFRDRQMILKWREDEKGRAY
ncbi:retropepsin-like aspartic protease family protein [Caulobacter sp. RL271]|uniref:TIGR02281 family clan AA aspartic protease n=1 Tax=Caulobacter segnis TaxID=88688 RepID=A0ABY4ZSW7_9CAUL|nr:TIGR02281 family clan AA aspartic protease [Caulobacter segnis]USQ95775.1 TIGR02281 family clan AA aspartic protease [Caulobacter segnis]